MRSTNQPSAATLHPSRSPGLAASPALLQAAEKQLRSNLRRGISTVNGKPYSFTVPDNDAYPFAWFWDSCLHAIIWTHFDIEQAKEELRTLLRTQRRNGRIPQRMAWEKATFYDYSFYLHSTSLRRPQASRLIQPPIIAQAIETVFHASSDRGFLEETVPTTSRFYEWLRDNRDPDGDSLLSIIHPYESGLDHKPSFSLVLGIPPELAWAETVGVRLLDFWNRALGLNVPRITRADLFNVEETLFNCLYAKNLRSLARLWGELGDSIRAGQCDLLAGQTESAILSKMRGPDGLFYDLYSNKEHMAPVRTFTGLAPLMLESIPPATASSLVAALTDESTFWLPFPVPSVSADEPCFRPGFETTKRSGLWRGPTWVAGNWFLVTALLDRGYPEEARWIAGRTLDLVSQHGFREFYNPYTGEPYGAKGFAWSTLAVDMVAGVAAGRSGG
jgi:glycogen debranching enzyme